MLQAPNLAKLEWLRHGFGQRDTEYPENITTLRQIHSDRVIDACGRRGDRIEEGDALVSAEPGVTIGVRTADCIPVLLADVRNRAVAAVHAGWRGTAAAILPAAVRALHERFDSRPQDLVAAVGPGIGACCYEVGAEVARQFVAWCPEMRHVETPVRLDLWGCNARQLREAGVEDVWIAGECTYCMRDHYHSFRREREAAGRMISFIGG